jgi:DNA-binding transcriptional LysR family regulator
MAGKPPLGLLCFRHADARPDCRLVRPGRPESSPIHCLTYTEALKSLAAAGQAAALLPLEAMEEQQQQSSVQIRHLSPTLMRPMAIAHRQLPTLNPAVASVLTVLANSAISHALLDLSAALPRIDHFNFPTRLFTHAPLMPPSD